MQPEPSDRAELVYSHKPSLMGAAWEFRLLDDALAFRIGAREGRVPYRSIRRVRLSFRPVTTQSRRFLAESWADGAPKLAIASSSWRSLFEQEARDDAYGAFIRELHRRLAAAGGAVSFERGSPALLYWPGLVIFAGTALALAALTWRALTLSIPSSGISAFTHVFDTSSGEGSWLAAALIVGFFALFLWQGGRYFGRNRPGRYRPEAPPGDLVPGG